ncbi:arylesterase [Salinimicrobium soli]|uniref:arylesterase n=1 Tax=Salinimicrobium soli TaxID=1254399 RepID=UPI003AAD14C6
MKTFLNIFIFPVIFFLMVSCGNEPKKQEQEKTAAEEVQSDVQQEDTQVILFFGNSLTAGMGLDTEESFPAVIQKKIDSLGLNYEVVNAGLSGETTASGKNRVDWVLNQEVDVFVLELGANDGLRGIPLEETKKNLQNIIDIVRKKDPGARIILAGMQIPPNLGPEYTSGFREIFPQLAAENEVELIPFLLEGVAGDPELNQPDGIHPTAEGQEIVAQNVWEVLLPVLKEGTQK